MADLASLCLFRGRDNLGQQESEKDRVILFCDCDTVTLALTNKTDMVVGSRPRANLSTLADGCWDGIKHPAPITLFPFPSLFFLKGCSFSLSHLILCGSVPIFFRMDPVNTVFPFLLSLICPIISPIALYFHPPVLIWAVVWREKGRASEKWNIRSTSVWVCITWVHCSDR